MCGFLGPVRVCVCVCSAMLRCNMRLTHAVFAPAFAVSTLRQPCLLLLRQLVARSHVKVSLTAHHVDPLSVVVSFDPLRKCVRCANSDPPGHVLCRSPGPSAPHLAGAYYSRSLGAVRHAWLKLACWGAVGAHGVWILNRALIMGVLCISGALEAYQRVRSKLGDGYLRLPWQSYDPSVSAQVTQRLAGAKLPFLTHYRGGMLLITCELLQRFFFYVAPFVCCTSLSRRSHAMVCALAWGVLAGSYAFWQWTSLCSLGASPSVSGMGCPSWTQGWDHLSFLGHSCLLKPGNCCHDTHRALVHLDRILCAFRPPQGHQCPLP